LVGMTRVPVAKAVFEMSWRLNSITKLPDRPQKNLDIKYNSEEPDRTKEN